MVWVDQWAPSAKGSLKPTGKNGASTFVCIGRIFWWLGMPSCWRRSGEMNVLGAGFGLSESAHICWSLCSEQSCLNASGQITARARRVDLDNGSVLIGWFSTAVWAEYLHGSDLCKVQGTWMGAVTDSELHSINLWIPYADLDYWTVYCIMILFNLIQRNKRESKMRDKLLLEAWEIRSIARRRKAELKR